MQLSGSVLLDEGPHDIKLGDYKLELIQSSF